MKSQSDAEQHTEINTFKMVIESCYHQIGSEDSLRKIRTKAWELYTKLGLPTKDVEVFRYIQLRKLFAQPYAFAEKSPLTSSSLEPYIYPECRNSFLIFVNGHFNLDLSNTSALSDRFVISSLQEAALTYGTLLNNTLTKNMKDEEDPFAVMNTALHRDGAFIYMTPKTISEVPVQILHVVDVNDSSSIMMPRLHIFMGAHSQLKLFTSTVCLSGSGYCINQVIDSHLEEGSNLCLTQVNCKQPDNVWHFEAVRATLKRQSTLKTVSVTDGSGMVRNDYRIALCGENAETTLNGLCMLKGKRECHSNILIDHQAPHCRSNQLFKGILSDFSRSSFEGKILVRQTAQKTEAFQLNNNLLLSDRSHADSKPNLEIFADDVKASHGATFGQLDPEQLIYMKMRGLSNAEAQNLLMYGFCQELLDMISLPSLQMQLAQHMRNS
jgi:Fe-S cluster assembly protein SufD